MKKLMRGRRYIRQTLIGFRHTFNGFTFSEKLYKKYIFLVCKYEVDKSLNIWFFQFEINYFSFRFWILR